jgi:SHS2 domain-containing protein
MPERETVEPGPEPPFVVVEHTADWALRMTGRDLGELFVHAAEWMAYLLVGDLSIVPLEQTRQMEITAYDSESLLVEWLSELAYWAEQAQLIFTRFQLQAITPTFLQAVVRGGRVAESEIQKHIKAVTYHDLAIRPTVGGLEVTVVFDV